MSSRNMTRWIEDADARSFSQAAMFDPRLGFTENQYLHLGEAIAKVPFWLGHNVCSGPLAAFGCYALAYARRLHERHSH